MRAILVALALLCIGTAAFAHNTCDGDSFGSVVIDGFAEVRYGDLHADSRADRAEFTRGVCILALDTSWSISADSVVFEHLSQDPRIDAGHVSVEFQGWHITGEQLAGTLTSLQFSAAEFVGPQEEYHGSAGVITANFETGRLAFQNIHVADRAFAITSSAGVLLGNLLTLEQATISTCLEGNCTFYNLTSTRAEVYLEKSTIMLEDGVVHLLGIPIPLASVTELSERALEKFEIPVDARVVSSASGPVRNGSGWLFVLKNMRYVPGMKMQAGFTGLNKRELLGVVALAELEPTRTTEADGVISTTKATVGVRANRPYLSLSTTRPVGEHSNFTTQFLTGADYGRDYRHELLLTLNSTPDVPWLPGKLQVEAFIGALALSPNTRNPIDTVNGLPLADARFGVKVTHQLSLAGGDHLTFGLQSSAQETYYPGHQVHQWGIRLQPSVRATLGPTDLSLGYVALFTNEASPFSTSIDRLTRTQRATASLIVRNVLPIAATSRIFSDVTYQFAVAGARNPGLRSWNSGIHATFALTPDWQLDTSLSTEIAKLLDTRASNQASVSFSATAEHSGFALVGSDPGGTFEIGTRWRYAITPTPALTRAEIFAGVPIVFERIELKPYLAVDFAGLIAQTGKPVQLSGHGLDVTFITHGGSFMVGYRAQNNNWDMRFGVDIYRRPVPANQAPEHGMIAD